MMQRAYMGWVLTAGLMMGCSNGPADDEPSAKTVTLTSVTAGGLSTVTLTADQAATYRERLAQAKADAQVGNPPAAGTSLVMPDFVVDSHCQDTSLYLYDSPNQSGNMICFTDVPGVTATADLLKYAYPGGGSWAGNQRALGLYSRVKSFWGGRQAAVGGCQNGAGQNPISCYASQPFEMMAAWGQGNINSNLRTIVEYHPVE
jgi:hypothetical protein